MDPLYPPLPPFGGSFRSGSSTPTASIKDGVSLTVNYLPSKFSAPLLHKRKGKLDPTDVPKRGGGREAFRTGEARMPGPGDEDYDGVMPSRGKTKPRLRWNRFKWILFATNTLLTVYSIIGLIFCLLTWFNVWKNADIIRVGNRPELILSTLAASAGILTCLLGWSGILLNNRAFLALYTLFLWITFGLLVVPGYVSYRRRAFNIEGKINSQWSRELGTFGRLRIQNELECCGYFNPFVEATVSQVCYARSILPGCKGPFLKFQKLTLKRWYSIVFGIVPFHIGIMVAALLCANHVTYRFGKGMMPKAYRLSLGSMAVIMDNYASQLAEQYGSEVAADVVARSNIRPGLSSPWASSPGSASTSEIGLDSMPSMPYASDNAYLQQQPTAGGRYGQVSTTPPYASEQGYPQQQQQSTGGGRYGQMSANTPPYASDQGYSQQSTGGGRYGQTSASAQPYAEQGYSQQSTGGGGGRYGQTSASTQPYTDQGYSQQSTGEGRYGQTSASAQPYAEQGYSQQSTGGGRYGQPYADQGYSQQSTGGGRYGQTTHPYASDQEYVQQPVSAGRYGQVPSSTPGATGVYPRRI